MEFESALRRLVREVIRDEIDRALEPFRNQLGEPARQEGYVDVNRAAELVSVSPYTIREWIQSGRLRSFRAGRVYRLRVADLRTFVESQEVQKIDVKAEAAELLAKMDVWDKARAELQAEANKRGEFVTPQQMTSRTRAALKKKYGTWPPKSGLTRGSRWNPVD
jgi:excisionase family DNA binding protein